MRYPLVTICVPVKNGESYLQKRVKNLLNQSYKNTNIVISDNNSNDATQEISQKLAKENKKISYYRQKKNLTVVENFNFLLNKARGDYCMWAAIDDYHHKDFIKECVKVFHYDKDTILCFSDFNIHIIETSINTFIPVQSSSSKSEFIRIATRCLDMQPHLIYGLFDRTKIGSLMCRNIDFFDCLFPIELSKLGRIRVIPKTLFAWKISNRRKSYSITGKNIQYLPFFYAVIKLLKKYSVLKKAFIAFIVLYFLIMKKLEHSLKK